MEDFVARPWYAAFPLCSASVSKNGRASRRGKEAETPSLRGFGLGSPTSLSNGRSLLGSSREGGSDTGRRSGFAPRAQAHVWEMGASGDDGAGEAVAGRLTQVLTLILYPSTPLYTSTRLHRLFPDPSSRSTSSRSGTLTVPLRDKPRATTRTSSSAPPPSSRIPSAVETTSLSLPRPVCRYGFFALAPREATES